MMNIPITCTLSPAALDARRKDLLTMLVGRASERRELPNGYYLQFEDADGILSAIAQAVESERQCCKFLRFTVTAEAADGPISLELTGPSGTREFLEAMFEER